MRASALLALLALASACGDDGEERVAIPCSIAEESCRRAIFGLTARLRNQRSARMPPSRIITREQYAQEARQEIAMQMSRPIDLQYEASLRLLNFLPAGTTGSEAIVESNIAGVAAYYAHDTKAVTIVADAAEDEGEGSLTLSHEYTHALQDEREGLQELASRAFSTDQIMAELTLVEGEATILSDAVMAEARGLDYDYAGLVSPALDRLLSSFLMDVAESPAPFTEAQLGLPYPIGGRPLAIAYSQRGYAGVAPYFQAWPDTLAEWIDPARANLPVAQRCLYPDPPAAYQRIVLDSYGATGLIALEVVLGADGPTAYDRARAWTADSMAVFAPLDQSIQAAIAWRITLGSAVAAQALLARLQATPLGLLAVLQNNDVVITAASAPGVLQGWTVRDDCSTSKALEAPQALWKHPPKYLLSLARARGAEGGIRTRTP
ncbi:MAG TPA: hypothetical protein VFX59_04155 [Polyangiales bacterium]|nr:hypothetical protein [Polyangiales bacterium]